MVIKKSLRHKRNPSWLNYKVLPPVARQCQCGGWERQEIKRYQHDKHETGSVFSGVDLYGNIKSLSSTLKQEANSIKHSIVNNCFYCTARAIVTNVYVRIFIQACYYLVSLSLHFFFCLKPIGPYFWKENNMASCLLSCFALCLFVCMKVLTEATGSERCTLKNSCAI